MSTTTESRGALMPQRCNGRRRVAALMQAGAAVIARKGYQAATMAEIAGQAGAPIGSLYRFFPNKEILADALIQRFGELVMEAFDQLDRRVKTMSMAALAEALLNHLADLQEEKKAVSALLEAHADWSAIRVRFRTAFRKRIAQTLLLRRPGLSPKMAADMAAILAQNMKMVGVLSAELKGEARAGALAELRDMTRIYLAAKLKER